MYLSPQEITLAAMCTTLETTMKTMCGMSAAAIKSVVLAENKVQQISANLTESKQTTRPTRRGRTTTR